jgi:hypothetical protein
MRNPPEMGHNMTSDSPAVRRAKVEATPVRGQEPTIKVKQEPPEIQAALTQHPAPVNEEEAALIGQRDPQSGRQILQPSNDIVQNERLANQAAPELNTRLSRIAAETPGAKFDRLRPQKGLRRLQEKVADGKPANTIGDNLAAQIVASTEKAKDQIIAGLSREFRVISVDDKFLEPRNKAGYPSTNVQVQMPNGTTAEVQIVSPEVQKITDKTHQYYTLGRNYPEGSPQRAWYWDQAAAMHMQALEKFQARTAAEQLAATLPPGQRVVLKNGQTGKIVGFTNKLDRVVVRTSKGLKTVKPADVTPLITRMDQAVSPKASPASEQHFIAAARRVGPQLSDPRAQQLSQRMLSDAEYYQNLRDNMRQEYNIDLSDAEQGNSMEGDEYKHVPAAVKQEWNARWKKVRSATPPTVELSKSERKIRLQAAVRRGKSEIISSKEGIPTIKLNDE